MGHYEPSRAWRGTRIDAEDCFVISLLAMTIFFDCATLWPEQPN